MLCKVEFLAFKCEASPEMKNYDKQERVLGPAKIKRTRKQAFTIKKIGNGDIRERK